MSFENDLGTVREAQFRFKKLRDSLLRLSEDVQILLDLRRGLEDATPLSFEEYLRIEKQIHSIREEDKGKMEKEFEKYLQMNAQQQKEFVTRLEDRRRRLNDTCTQLKRELDIESQRHQLLVKKIDKIRDSIRALMLGLEKHPKLMTLEEIHGLQRHIEEHDWARNNQ